jgi:uncharacterized protein (UPF0303 family)
LSSNPDLNIVCEQEQRVQFYAFDENAAFSIGSAIRERGLALGLPLVIDIRINERRLFFSALPGSTISLANWVGRKMNTVRVFNKSTYRMVLEKPRPDYVFEPAHNLPASEYVVVGGAFPITIGNVGVVGSMGVAGAHMRDDHGMVVEAACRHLGLDYAALALPPLS